MSITCAPHQFAPHNANSITTSDTFFGKKTSVQYTCELFKSSKEDSAKFDAVFSNRIAYTKSINDEIKV